MTKAELESKPLSDLHLLAADAGIERYRMLSRGELIERLSDGAGNGDASGGASAASESRDRGERSERGERPARRRRRRGGRDGGADEDAGEREAEGEAPQRRERQRERGGERDSGRVRRDRPERAPEREPVPEPPASGAADSGEPSRPRRRRRRRFGRRGKQELTLQTLLLPPEAGRQAILYAESRETCSALLHSVAADIASDPKGPDPVALLIDPSPEELADWRRDAPQAEIVAAGQPRHASDALAQAAARANSGEHVFLLVDSLTRLAEAYGDADAAKEFFDAARDQAGIGGGTLTIVAALEKPAG